MTAVLAIAASTGFAQMKEPTQPEAERPGEAQSEASAGDKESAVTGIRSFLIRSATEPKTTTSGSLTSPGSWHFDVGSRGECPGCTASGIQPPGNPNAPWAVRSRVTYAAAGARLTLGVVGHRNYQLPLFMSETLAGDYDLVAPESSPADLSRNQTRWQLSARVQKTVKRLSGGQTIGLVGDAFIPIGSEAPAVSARDAPKPPSAAVRFGIILGF
jgi:hypothetical protein